MTRDGVKGLGLSLLPDERVASDTVTAVKIPDGVDASRLLGMMREDHDIVLGGGQQSLNGKIFRIGHMGYCAPEEIQDVLAGLAQVLPQVGFTPGTVETSSPRI